ncbi:GntR family transcriptional regulator [Candidatus Aerophobetes bacterium]|nr:GntR family transcriptional regulator [Candidatus Aerophobetes bacterium]
MEQKLENPLENYQTKNSMVYTYLKHQIQNGYLKPREKIVISTIARELGISTIPVRDAVNKLASEGLIDFTPHKTPTVAVISAEDIEQIYTLRIILEPFAAEVGVVNLSSEEIIRLSSLVKKMERITRERNFEEYFDVNTEIHFTLYNASKNRWLVKVIDMLWKHTRWANAAIINVPKHAEGLLEDHIEMQKAFEERNKERVKFLFERHLKRAKRGVLKYFYKTESKNENL